ncbi:MAG: PEP-CTERM sorting domain-containing protein [Opitutales bacterium]
MNKITAITSVALVASLTASAQIVIESGRTTNINLNGLAAGPTWIDVTVDIDGAGNASLGSLGFSANVDAANTALPGPTFLADQFEVSGTTSVAAAFSSSFTVRYNFFADIDTATGLGTVNADGLSFNALGGSITTNPDGNFTGSDGAEQEAHLLGLDTALLDPTVLATFTEFRIGDNESDNPNLSGPSTLDFYTDLGTSNVSTLVANPIANISSLGLSQAGGNGLTDVFSVAESIAGENGFRQFTTTLVLSEVPEPATTAAVIAGAAFALVLLRRHFS